MNFLKDVREFLTPVMTESNFEEKGMLTPEEFVVAGDELVSKCGSWRWEAGKKEYRKSYLPDKKQYLITRGVPSLVRASTYAMADSVETVVDKKDGGDIDDEGWLETHTGGMTAGKSRLRAGVGGGSSGGGGGGEEGTASSHEQDLDEITEIGADIIDTPVAPSDSESKKGKGKVEAPPGRAAGSSATSEPAPTDRQERSNSGLRITSETYIKEKQTEEEVQDIEEIEEHDEGALVIIPSVGGSGPGKRNGKGEIIRAVEPEDRIIKTRTYDLSITYDNYHRTPRMWLFGHDEQQQPLSNDGIMEDISADHKFKTVTVDPHPHTNVPHASIHPCRHAQTMKSICDRLSQVDTTTVSTKDGKKVQIQQYLFVFLKFISSVVPTIEYDYTSSV
eukprot:gb/GEZN01008343.1/.p1 GENE.gb/GEZN01008343.1/~~gb/GEZN01008343.1/.p1  ORF type:complete len:391 (+),score=65.61 gb/GEZN01008343.1/:85-1257(+)